MSKQDKQDRLLWQKFKMRPAHYREKMCPDETMLAGYIDGRLSAPDSDRIESHLVDCPDCLSSVLGLRVGAQEIGEHPPPELIRQLKKLAPAKHRQSNLNQRLAAFGTETLFKRLRYGLVWAAAAMFIFIASAGGYKLGRETLMLRVNLVKHAAVEGSAPFEPLIASPLTEDVK